MTPTDKSTPRCLTCKGPLRRKLNPNRPCCRKCERSGVPMAIQAPGLFTKGPAALVAKAASDAVREQLPEGFGHPGYTFNRQEATDAE